MRNGTHLKGNGIILHISWFEQLSMAQVVRTGSSHLNV